MSKLNDDLRWAKSRHSHSNETDTIENRTLILKLSNDHQQFSAFNTLKKKYLANQLKKKDYENTNTIKKNNPKQANTKLDGSVLENMQYTTDKNSLGHLNMCPEASHGFNNTYTNLSKTKSVKNESNFSNCTQILTEPIVLNSTQLETSNCTTESWREMTYVYEMKHAWLSYLNYSITGSLIPSISTITNPFEPIPIEVSRLAKNNDLNRAELFCRKRMETAVISWMVSKYSQCRSLRTN